MTTDTHSNLEELPSISNSLAQEQEMMVSSNENKNDKSISNVEFQDKAVSLEVDGPVSSIDGSMNSEPQLLAASSLSPNDGSVSISIGSPSLEAANPSDDLTQEQPVYNFLNTEYARNISKSIALDSSIQIRTLENSYTNFKRGTTSGRSLERMEANLLKYGFHSNFTEPWFKLFQKLETVFKPVSVNTLIVILYFQDPKKTPEYSMDFDDASSKEIRELITKVTKAFNYFKSKDYKSFGCLTAQRALFRRLNIDISSLYSWFEGFHLILSSNDNAELITLIRVFLSQVWRKTIQSIPGIIDNDKDLVPLLSLALSSKNSDQPPSELNPGQSPSELDPNQSPPKLDSNQSPSKLDPSQSPGQPIPTQVASPQFDWEGEDSDEDPSVKDLDFNFVQHLPCNSARYVKFPRCRSCIAKQTDICRFKYVRLFAHKSKQLVVGHRFLKPENIELLGENVPKVYRAGKKRVKKIKEDQFEIPQLPLAPLTHMPPSEKEIKDNALYTMSYIAPSLFKVLKAEIAHIEDNRSRLSYRRPCPLMGQTCDACSTGIFSAFWMCRTCGKELCLSCYHRWDVERVLRSSALELCCFRAYHKKAKFFPVTNYLPETIQSLMNSVKDFISKQPSEPELNTINPALFFQPEYPSLPFPYCEPSDMTVKDFQACWQHGQPTVLKSSPGNPKYPCTPDHLTEYYGDVQTEVLKPGGLSLGLRRVSAFFESFDDPEKGQLNMKIKDWPSQGSFGDYFPHLNRDFTNQLPFPEYMSYTGSLNLVSLLPKSSHKVPDLGPKMYAAYAGSSGSTVGTTQLHLDAADAINILQYSGGPKDAPGAIWDLFRREDADELRDYIRLKFGHIYFISDPIHDQAFYLTDEILQDIYECKGIRSHRVYQKIGEVVLVPAGCPHQVRNLHPCIKLAMDFVAPEGAAACLRLVSQFRTLPPGHRRGVDIIGTSTLLARSWATCLEKLGLPSPFENDDVAPLVLSKNIPSVREKLPRAKRSRRASTESDVSDNYSG